MKALTKIMTLLLAFLMVISPLAACDKTPETPEDTTVAATDPVTEAPTEAPTETPTETPTEAPTEGDTEPETEPEPTVERVPDDRDLTAAQYSVLNITGTDDFGRVISPVDGKVNADRYVGMFYFLTLGQHSNHTGIYDINKITFDSTYHDAFTRFDTFITPVGSAHFWGEPVWGYYHSCDAWVLSFQRLAFRVFDEMGMTDLQILEETGKNLVLRKVAQEQEENLTVLRGNMHRMGYISEVKSFISEYLFYFCI